MNFKKLGEIVLAFALAGSVQIGYAEEWQTIDNYQIKNGVAKDTKTDLMWMRCPLGMQWKGETCVGNSQKYTWKKAIQTAKNSKYEGYKDWRVPTADEFGTISDNKTDNQDGKPNIINQVFPRSGCNNTQIEGNCYVWTSSNREDNKGFMLISNIYIGGHTEYSGKDGKFPVQLVRGETLPTKVTDTAKISVNAMKLTEQDKNKTIAITQGETFMVSLNENSASSGYSWAVEGMGDVLTLQEEKFVMANGEEISPGLPDEGASDGGKKIFIFVANKIGKTTLTFKEARHWSRDKSDVNKFDIQIEVKN